MKIYTKSNHLILAIPMTLDGYEWAVKLRNCLIGYCAFLWAVGVIDKILEGWGEIRTIALNNHCTS